MYNTTKTKPYLLGNKVTAGGEQVTKIRSDEHTVLHFGDETQWLSRKQKTPYIHHQAYAYVCLDGREVLLASLGVRLHRLVTGLPSGRAHLVRVVLDVLQRLQSRSTANVWSCQLTVVISEPPG